ncbi:MAG: hypothetical protein ABJA70_11995 [Chryseolinea sp.]
MTSVLITLLMVSYLALKALTAKLHIHSIASRFNGLSTAKKLNKEGYRTQDIDDHSGWYYEAH